MKCGGLYPVAKNFTVEANGGVSYGRLHAGNRSDRSVFKTFFYQNRALVAAKENVVLKADCIQFPLLYYKNPVEGGFIQET